MDRIALAKRLESLSSVFASHTPYNRDLRAMAYVLNKMADDKFTSILSGDFTQEDVDSCMCGKGPGSPLQQIIPMGKPMPEEAQPADEPVLVIKTEGGIPMSAEATEKTAGMFWCKEASMAVVDNLLRDVVGMNKSQCCSTGAKLESKQVPNGSHDGEKAPTLKPEQTPDDAASIKTNMVEKSRGAVKKEAGSIKGPGIPDGTGPMKDSPECKMKKEEEKEAGKAPDIAEKMKAKKEEADKEKLKKDVKELKKGKKASEDSDEKAEQAAEKMEDEAQKDVEKAKEQLEKAEEKLEEAKKVEEKAESEEKDASSSITEGIELMASMDEVELDANEAAELSKLFE